MMECYYSWCPMHQRDEPFCRLSQCVASTKELKLYARLRYEDIKQFRKLTKEEEILYTEIQENGYHD